MKTTCLLLLIISAITSSAQTRFSIGPEFSIPTFKEIKSTGIGLGAGIQFRSKRKTSMTIETGYNYFHADAINQFRSDTIHNYAFVPLLAGPKFNFSNKLYGALRAGITFGTNRFQKHPTFSAAAGLTLPNNQHPKFDIGARWLGMPGMPSFKENIFIDRGGFSYLNIRAAIIF